MAVSTFILSIGFDKNGETEFDAHFAVTTLPFDEMQKLRAIIPVAISELERIWRDHGPPSKEMACAVGQSPGKCR